MASCCYQPQRHELNNISSPCLRALERSSHPARGLYTLWSLAAWSYHALDNDPIVGGGLHCLVITHIITPWMQSVWNMSEITWVCVWPDRHLWSELTTSFVWSHTSVYYYLTSSQWTRTGKGIHHIISILYISWVNLSAPPPPPPKNKKTKIKAIKQNWINR